MIMPGLFARVRVPVAEDKAALVVPQQALGFDQQGSFILVVNGKNVVERRAVTTGTEVDGFRVVEEGLQGEEWVVVEGVIKAIPGRPVNPEKKELKAPPPKDEAASQKGLKRKAGS
jgi:multidrug efflux pump subunit AcrA (membrane-fusion protein)